jgi:hypothetical protein
MIDPMNGAPVPRTIAVLDIVGFADPSRTDPIRAQLRHRLYKLIRQALARAEIEPDAVPRFDIGDGVILLFHPHLSAARVVGAMMPALARGLTQDNKSVSGNERLRLRLALHRGEVLIDAHGFVGSALVEASRLSNATVLRERLAATNDDLVLTISDDLWKQLLQPGHWQFDPGRFDPVSVSVHGVSIRAWVLGHDDRSRPTPASPSRNTMPVAPVYRSIVALDIQGSTDATRTHPVKERLRRDLYGLLGQALLIAGIKEQHRDPMSDQGDGILLLVHPVDDIPKTQLLRGLIPELVAGLAAHNHTVPPEERLLLRAALHAGEIHHDRNGYYGNPLDVAFRLLGARKFKGYRRNSTAPLVLVVSEDIYQSVVWHNYEGIDRATYQRLFSVRVAGRLHYGWVHTPGPPDIQSLLSNIGL